MLPLETLGTFRWMDRAWYVLRFYFECLSWAAAGSLDRANAWFWVFGIVPVALAGRYFEVGALTVPDNPKDFIVFMVVTVIVSFILIFILRCLIAPAVLAGKLEADRDALRQAAIPRISFFLDGVTDDGSIPISPTVVLRQGADVPGPNSKWVQVSVSCATEAPLVNSEVWLTSVRRLSLDENGAELEGEELVEEHIRCIWSQEEAVTTDVRPLVVRRANLFALHDLNPVQIDPCTKPVKIRLPSGIVTPGRYRVTLVATAHQVRSVRRSFVFEWSDFDHVTFRQEQPTD